MSYDRDWSKLWYTVDPGTVVEVRSLADASNDRYISTLFAIKDRLVSPGLGAWTVLASSGKAGGGSLVADTNDNWLSSADLVTSTSGSGSRSWILLKSPTTQKAGTFYLLIDFWGTSALYANFYFTKSQPDISSPVVNARPPATGNEWSHTGVLIVRAADGSQYITSMTAIRANDGSFVIGVCSPIGEEHAFNAIYMLNVLRGTKSWDTTKAASLVLTNRGSRLRYNSTMAFRSLHSDGSVVTLEPVWFRVAGNSVYSWNLVDPWTDKWITWPVPMVCSTAGAKTFRGELEDIYYLGDDAGDGIPMFANEVVKAIRMGPFSIPFDQLGGSL